MEELMRKKLYAYNQIYKNNQIIKLSREKEETALKIKEYKKQSDQVIDKLSDKINKLENDNEKLVYTNRSQTEQLSRIPNWIKRIWIRNKKELSEGGKRYAR